MSLLRLAAGIILVSAVAAGQAAPQPKPAKSGLDPDKMVCKRYVRTGSLVDGYRICKTNKEWAADMERSREAGESIIRNQCTGEGPCKGN